MLGQGLPNLFPKCGDCGLRSHYVRVFGILPIDCLRGIPSKINGLLGAEIEQQQLFYEIPACNVLQ